MTELLIAELGDQVRTLQGQMIGVSRSLGAIEAAQTIASEQRRDTTVMVLDIGKALVRIESTLGETLGKMDRAEDRVAARFDKVEAHVGKHCTELDLLKTTKQYAAGVVKGASLTGGLVATAVGGMIAGGWALATHFGWFK